MRSLFTCLALGSMLLASCAYGPPRTHSQIENVRAKPDSHLIAVAVKYQELRDPEGVNTFPNGGRADILNETADIYLCAVDTEEITRICSVPPPAAMKASWEPWILGWSGDALIFQLTGRAGTSAKDFETLNKALYRVEPDGTLSEPPELPDDITFQHNTGPLPDGTFVRVSKAHNVIDIRTEDLADWRPMLTMDIASGALVLIE